MATLSNAWHYRVSAMTGWPPVSMLWQVEIAGFILNFYFSVTACKIVQANPFPKTVSSQETNNLPGSFFMSRDTDGASLRKEEGDGVEGMKAATSKAVITSTAPKANGGPGTMFCKTPQSIAHLETTLHHGKQTASTKCKQSKTAQTIERVCFSVTDTLFS